MSATVGSRSADVVVVGAGLAGLRCADVLVAAGRDVVVVEAADRVGGRVATDEVDGFLLDHGFQVLLTGYPEAQAAFDYDALDLRAFAPGVGVGVRGRFHVLADPLQDPVAGIGAALSPVTSMADKLRLLRLRVSLQAADGQDLAEGPNRTTLERLRADGFGDRAIERFFRPFLAGVFFDPDLTTSERMFALIMRSFFNGDVAVPNGGMAAMPAQLADRVGRERVLLGQRVARVAAGEVDVLDGDRLVADHVVVAVEGPEAGRLLGVDAVDAPPGRGTATAYYAAPDSPVADPLLLLDGERSGPVNNVAVMSDVAPGYASDGRALVSCSVVGVPEVDDGALDRGVRAHLRGWFGGQVDRWERLPTYRIPYAQPRQDPGDLPTLRRDVRVADGLWVCGDHRDTASIQGALVSGRRTAEAILAARR